MPLVWAFIGGSAALLFGVVPDYVLLAAGVVLLAVLVGKRPPTVRLTWGRI